MDATFFAFSDAAPAARVLMLTVSEDVRTIWPRPCRLVRTVICQDQSDQLADTIDKVTGWATVISPEMMTKLVAVF